ncbi:MAG TPA: murein L,D-transpeptidase catalytic domain family protein [Gammaproteobacteria bacterium]|nr:murein L,D-transpeptidase catalytic domain family protein [Gammaproteobacteria bacterium]
MLRFNKQNTIYAVAFFLVIWCCHSWATPFFTRVPFVPGLKPEVLTLATNAYNNAKSLGIGNKDVLTIVDYSLPSTARRLWVIDMNTQQVLFNTHVAHGSGSGSNFATKFSNQHGSRMSSLGLFLTAATYDGNYGRSLNLIGLEDNFNSNAEARRIVFHKAHYVSESIIKQIGRLGRSFGCLALNHKVADQVMHAIKEGSLVFCYYPDAKWLAESKFL